MNQRPKASRQPLLGAASLVADAACLVVMLPFAALLFLLFFFFAMGDDDYADDPFQDKDKDTENENGDEEC